MMKKIIIILLIVGFSTHLTAQVGIKTTTLSSKSVLLEFGASTTDGIILPAVTNVTAVTPANGMILFDRNDAKLKYYQNGAWVELSKSGDVNKAPTANPSSDNSGAGVLISDMGKDNVLGAVELRSETKAMVLPKVANPHTSIPSPVAGTMVYDTVSQSVALFDGLVWNYLVEE